MSVPAYRVWISITVILTTVCVALPVGPLTHVGLIVTGLLASTAMMIAVRRYRPLRTAPWAFLAAGVGFQALGDAVYYFYLDVLSRSPFPSPADIFYLTGSPLKIIGLVLLVRGRQSDRDHEGLIDAGIFTASLSLLTWILLISPTLGPSDAPLVQRALGLAYPLLDTLLLGLLVRLLTTQGGRTPTFAMLVAACALLLLADYLFFLLSFSSDDHPVLIDDMYSVSYGLWAAAALHPSMVKISQPAAERPRALSRTRLIGLTIAGLTAPGVLAVQLILKSPVDGWAIVVSSWILFCLVIARIALMLKQIEFQAQELSDLARTDGLTGLLNRRGADAELGRRHAQVVRTGGPLVVALIDLDRFKTFNDTHGHAAGDQLLGGCASAWRSTVEDTSAVIARYGGEEFLLISSTETLDEIAGLLVAMREHTPHDQTFSAGVALWDRTEPLPRLVARADRALYAAKRSGRNRTTIAEASASARLGAPTPTTRGQPAEPAHP